ncbi:nucleotidyl transferase AbiEii/AbiGii toxin family protein [Streptococcus sp. A11]|uniref:nucleotidyl transferase AbiEii/AbiGii toxin family protein n=1 Tax=Streptococcus sp. A11 TaxID=3373124 RepID=UPI00374C9BAB
MKFSNANSFKAKVKNIAREKGIPAQQVQQNFLIEQVLKLISESRYKDSFIVKGGFLIGQMIGLDKRTTMDLDVTLKDKPLNEESIQSIFKEIINRPSEGFQFEIDKLEPIRQDEIDVHILNTALHNTAKKRESLDILINWEEQLETLRRSDYQKQLWSRYQKSFRYASETSFEESVDIVAIILNHLEV